MKCGDVATMTSPCHGCPDRQRACHDVCPSYIHWLKRLRTIKAALVVDTHHERRRPHQKRFQERER